MTNSHAPADDAGPRRVLRVFDAVMIAMGIVIGAGIFKTPALVAQLTGSTPAMLGVWIAGGLLSLVGALTYAELASCYPSSGGDYHFLRRAFGRDFSFFFAWARVSVITTGSIALLAYVLGDYLTAVYDLGAYSSAIYAALATCLLTVVNLSGLRQSARVQNVLTLLEIAGLALVAVAGWMAHAPDIPAAATTDPSASLFGAALVFVLLTYGGWNDAAYVSAEVGGGPRAIVRVLLIAVLAITALYVAVVVLMVHGLGLPALQNSAAPGADLMQSAFGHRGAQLIGIIVALSALTSMNGTMLVGARTNHALGVDWPLLAFLGRWHADRNLPRAGFLVQAGIALMLIAFGAIEQRGFTAMVEFTAPAFWFFFMTSGLALFVLRRREPLHERPFRVPLYPLLPALFVVTCAGLLYSSIAYARSQQAGYVSLAVMAVGAVLWLSARFTARRSR